DNGLLHGVAFPAITSGFHSMSELTPFRSLTLNCSSDTTFLRYSSLGCLKSLAGPGSRCSKYSWPSPNIVSWTRFRRSSSSRKQDSLLDGHELLERRAAGRLFTGALISLLRRQSV